MLKKVLLVVGCVVACVFAVPVSALTEEQEKAIPDYCETIRENLKKVQKQDARTRVYLGGYYETILTKFITPLNLRMVENNLSDPGLIENQSKMAEAKATFVNDYVHYQQELETLVGMDCKKEPKVFYEQLTLARKVRKKVEQDVAKMRSILASHVKLVQELREKVR